MKYPVFTLARAADEDRGRTFAPQSAPLVGMMFVPLFVGALLVWWFALRGEGAGVASLFGLLRAMLPAFGFCAVFGVVAARMSRVRVGEAGVSGQGMTGRFGVVALTWAEMETVTPVRVAELTYLRVTSFKPGTAPLLLPPDVTSNAAFRRTVIASASPLNPLRQSVESGNSQTKRERLPAL